MGPGAKESCARQWMTNGRFLRVGVRGSTCFFVALATLACFIGDPNPMPGPVVLGDAQAPVDVGVVEPVDTGSVDSGPATGPACRGDLDCTQGLRTHCLLDPGRAGFCVQCAPEQGFTCAEGLMCTGGVCVEGTSPPITGPACSTDAQCSGADRPRCVPSGAAGGARVCAQCSPTLPCVPGSVCAQGACIGQGALRFTLTWDRPGDVDLHVVTPGGREIYYGARTQDGGELDRDDTTGTGPENVFWAASPPAGSYLLCVVPFSVTGATSFTLSIVRTPGGEVSSTRGTRSASTGNVACSRASPDFVTEFRY
jgi:hypothetical protein